MPVSKHFRWISRKPRTPAVAVKRLGQPHDGRAEKAAAVAVLCAILALFLLVRAEPQQRPPFDPAAFLDFRIAHEAGPAMARAGQTTPQVGLSDALQVLGARAEDALEAHRALLAAFPGDQRQIPDRIAFKAFFEQDPQTGLERLAGVSLAADAKTTLMASRRMDGDFMAAVLNARTALERKRIAGVVETDLASAIIAGGGSELHARQIANLFPGDESLARGGEPGDRFDLVIEVTTDERGAVLEAGDLLFAAYNGLDSSGSWYRFTPEDTGIPQFFDRYGAAGDILLLREPVKGIRAGSPFGMRIHPISGDYALHAGVDFPAPIGTPIQAAGSGLITDMRWGDGYGWFIRIRHERGYETIYAHMSAFADDLTPGMTVMRGDIIGYVGDTGSTTGPHLHYEVLRNGIYVDPMRVAMPSGRDLSGDLATLSAFEAERNRIDSFRTGDAFRLMADVSPNTATAGRGVAP